MKKAWNVKDRIGNIYKIIQEVHIRKRNDEFLSETRVELQASIHLE